jgi:hypothetical protein
MVGGQHRGIWPGSCAVPPQQEECGETDDDRVVTIVAPLATPETAGRLRRPNCGITPNPHIQKDRDLLSHTSNIDRLGPSLERLPRLASHNTDQSHRGSNPCLHLERVGRYVQGVQTSAVLPDQNGCLVQPVHSIGPSIAEKMDNCCPWPDILLTSSQLAFWAQVRAHQTCRSALPQGWHGRRSGALFGAKRVRSGAELGGVGATPNRPT